MSSYLLDKKHFLEMEVKNTENAIKKMIQMHNNINFENFIYLKESFERIEFMHISYKKHKNELLKLKETEPELFI